MLACAVLLVGCSVTVAMVPAPVSDSADDLGELASHVLAYLDHQHVLGKIVYSSDSGAALSIIGCLLPPNLGFRLDVHDANWDLLWSAKSNCVGESGSASYYLSGINGTFMPLIVVLRISR